MAIEALLTLLWWTLAILVVLLVVAMLPNWSLWLRKIFLRRGRRN